jgi:hypothetical protein
VRAAKARTGVRGSNESSSAPITPSRPTSSATATTPHADVSDASAAPIRLTRQPSYPVHRTGAFPQQMIWVLNKLNHPCWQGIRSLRHAVLLSYLRIRV